MSGFTWFGPSYTGWWFGTFFIFHDIWDNPSHWLIFFKMVKTTNQYMIYMMIQIYMIWLECEDFRGCLYILSRAWQRNDLLSVDITSLRHWKCVPKVRMGTSPSVFCLFFTCSLSKAHAGKIWNHAGCCFEFLLMQEHCRHVRCDRKVGHLTFPLAVNSFPRFMIFGSYMVLLVIFTGPY